MTFVPVTALPWAGATAASLDTCLTSGVMAARGTADDRMVAPARAVICDLPQRQRQASASVMPGLVSTEGQQSNLHKTYTDAIPAAAHTGSQTGSLPAWDPV